MLSRNCSCLLLLKLCLAHLYTDLKVVVLVLSYVKKPSNIMSPTSNS